MWLAQRRTLQIYRVPCARRADEVEGKRFRDELSKYEMLGMIRIMQVRPLGVRIAVIRVN